MKMNFLCGLVLVFSGVCCSRAMAEALLVEDVTVIPMTGEKRVAHRDVLIREGKIAAVVAHGDPIEAVADATVVPGAGRYLIPGLCDMHVHIRCRVEEQQDMLFLFLANGVTSILNMSGSPEALRTRDRLNQGALLGPRYFTTTPIIGNIVAKPTSVEKGRELVRKFHADGYDFIKVYNMIPKEGYEGIMAEAKELGMPAVGHAVRSVGIEGAIATGQDIAHMEEFIYGYFEPDFDESKIAPLAQRLKANGIDVVATLLVYHNILRQVEDIESMLKSPGIEYMPKSLTHTYPAEANPYLKKFDAAALENRLRPHWAFIQKLTKAFNDAGVKLLAGTDTPVEIVVPGYSLHDELEELVAAGLTSTEALRAATSAPATFLGREAMQGTIEVGKVADMVLLGADPLEDIENTRVIEGVFAAGRWIPKQEIDARLAEIKARVAVNE